MIRCMQYIIVLLGGIVAILLLFIKKRLESEKRYKQDGEYWLEKCREQHKRITELETKVSEYTYFRNLIEKLDGDRIIKIVENNTGYVFAVIEHFFGNSLDIYLLNIGYERFNSKPRVLTTVKEAYIWIDDIFAIDENCGNGSILLSSLEDKAKELGVRVIKGELSYVDKDHFDKLEHFYKKNGFEVWFNDDRSHGIIKKSIK